MDGGAPQGEQSKMNDYTPEQIEMAYRVDVSDIPAPDFTAFNNGSELGMANDRMSLLEIADKTMMAFHDSLALVPVSLSGLDPDLDDSEDVRDAKQVMRLLGGMQSRAQRKASRLLWEAHTTDTHSMAAQAVSDADALLQPVDA